MLKHAQCSHSTRIIPRGSSRRPLLCQARSLPTAGPSPSSSRPLRQRDRPHLPPSIEHAALESRATFPSQDRISHKTFSTDARMCFCSNSDIERTCRFAVCSLFLCLTLRSQSLYKHSSRKQFYKKLVHIQETFWNHQKTNEAKSSVTSLYSPPLPPVLRCTILQTRAPLSHVKLVSSRSFLISRKIDFYGPSRYRTRSQLLC